MNLEHFPLDQFPLDHFQLDHFPLEQFPIRTFSFEHFPVFFGAPEQGKTDLGKTSVLPKPDLGKTCQKSNLAIPEEGKTELGQTLQT